MKKLLAILLVVSLLLVCPVPVKAAATSGQCGDNLTWTLSGNTLTISGTGPMYDYTEENPAPWMAAGTIRKINVKDGVTSIGNWAFCNIHQFQAYIPASVTYVGSGAVGKTNSSAMSISLYFLGDAPTFAQNAFSGRTVNAYYHFDWDPAILKNYGGRSCSWDRKDVYLTGNITLYQLNQEIKISDFSIYVRPGDPIEYTPREVIIGDYDNSTYGQKTVKITVDGYEFEHMYYVTDGQNHFDLIQVEVDPYAYYDHGRRVSPSYKVTVNDVPLSSIDDYTASNSKGNDGNLCYDGQITITGKGTYQGYQKVFTYAILRKDISEASVTINNPAFIGGPVSPTITVRMGASSLKEGKDYIVFLEQDINVGTAVAHIVGIGNYRGSVRKQFEIYLGGGRANLQGAYNGTATETPNGQVYYSEHWIGPGLFMGTIQSNYDCYSHFQLYRMEGDTPVLVTTQEEITKTFHYDFSSVYTDAVNDGGAVYMLAYAWVDSQNNVYSGTAVLYIPAQLPDASEMAIEGYEGDGDFRQEYLTVYGLDGELGDVVWSSSDPSVATITNGVVTLKKPGTVTITAQCADLTAEHEIQVATTKLSQCEFFRYDINNGKAYLACDYIEMEEGVDYVTATSTQGDVTEVTVTGTGLFTGQLVRQFQTKTGEAIGNTHYFDDSSDSICDGCGFSRDDTSEKAVLHQYEADGKEITDYYDTVEEALSAASSGTIKLQKDAIIQTAVLKPGVTLDLNGCTLAADILIAMDQAKVLDGGKDCVGGGLLKIAKGNLVLAEDNDSVIPVWNGTDGYVFTKVTFQQLAKEAGTDATQYIFLPDFSNAEAESLLIDGGLDNGLNIKVCLTWNDGYSQQFYTYADDLVKQVFDGTGSLAFDLTVTGIASIADMTASPVVATGCGVQATTAGVAVVSG